jgi:hypothetical protein
MAQWKGCKNHSMGGRSEVVVEPHFEVEYTPGTTLSRW